jgi:uncharacterized membrane protein YfcA
MTWIAAYAVGGALVGFLAGMLGIGGGMTLVPLLSAMFTAQGFAHDHIVHLALATAMAAAIFTSAAGAHEHHRRRAVDWSIVKRMAPGMLIGTLASTVASGWVPQQILALAFAAVVYAASAQMLLGKKPQATRSLPGALPVFLVGVLIGIAAGLVSAGGAFLSMPFMVFCGVPVITAIGTGAALSIPVAIMGSLGYVAAGWNIAALPPYSLGFIYLPALAAMACASVLTAPYGAALAHRLPLRALRRVFALLLFILATRMLLSYW